MDEKYIASTPLSALPLDRGIEKAIVALKKGAHLLKYGRRGKPKFCPFRLSSDEKVLIWYSGKDEKQLKLSSVTKILPGQRTVNFQRQPQPERECQSFSLLYANGERSLDLICKDKDQAETWFIGLTALVSRSHYSKQLANLRHGRGAHSCINSPISHVRRKHHLGLLEDSPRISQVRSLCGSPRPQVERGFSDGVLYSNDRLYSLEPRSSSNMRTRMDTSTTVPSSEHSHSQEKVREMCHDDGHRMSLPGLFSSSNHWSLPAGKDDFLRDVFMWGEGMEGGALGGGSERSNSRDVCSDALLPKLLESTGMLDVQKVSCGGKHAALVTRQGEVFCWGEEKGGRLGHRINMDVSHPKFVDSLTDIHVESIACGEYQTCALSVSGELYAWGECSQVDDRSGGGNNGSWWLPRRVAGPLDGICISSVACGEWHTAVVSSSGQLFTYGDGMFGVLGHGNLESTSQPIEVKSLRGLRVKAVACGPWHTAAVVEVIVDRSRCNSPGGKVFTWGDGDKGRLGHSDKEKKLLPTCVASLVDHDFVQVSCGRTLTVALTITGMVCTMGSAVHGQLGNPLVEDKAVGIVEGNLKGELVKEISSGSYHVAVLTAKGNVYTWGMGSNGRLGLGDIEDRNSPSLVEALKDRQVLGVACGSSFTAAICLHKSISSSDQSVCSGCRMFFGFTRKKHNCYNCGLVFCHACSSKKAKNASLAPNKSKQYRVCDPCFLQLRNHADLRPKQEAPSPRPPLAMRKPSSDPKVDREEPTSARSHVFSPKLLTHGEVRCPDGQSLSKQGSNQLHLEPLLPMLSTPPRWGQVACPAVFDACEPQKSMIFAPPKGGLSVICPAYRQKSPPRSRSMTPIAPSLEKCSAESDKMLKEEVQKLRAEAKSLAKLCQMRNEKLQEYQLRIEETWSLAREEVAKHKAAKEVIKVLTAQLNAMSEKVSSGREPSSVSDIADKFNVDLPKITPAHSESLDFNEMGAMFSSMHSPTDARSLKNRELKDSCGLLPPSCNAPKDMLSRGHHRGHTESIDDSLMARTDAKQNGVSKAEWVEQDDPGVYITFMTLPCGQKVLKRVRFSRKRFSQKEAEQWWEENQLRVYQKYGIEAIVSTGSNRMSG